MFSIRHAEMGDAGAIRALILASVEEVGKVDFDEQGWETFLRPNSLDEIRRRIQDGQHITLVAEADGQLIGIITLFGFERIHQLFVLPEFHRQGVATQLWQIARGLCEERGNTGGYRVLSSSMAVPVYQSFGFALRSDRKVRNGIAFFEMELESDGGD